MSESTDRLLEESLLAKEKDNENGEFIMTQDDQKQYYQLVLREYASPAFCSFAKFYHGTISDIRKLMDALAAINDDGCYNNLLHAFQEWEHGNTAVTHDVAFLEFQLLTPEEMVACKEYTLEKVGWRHINVWEYAYDMKAEAILVREIVLKQGDKYIRCIRPVFENLMVSVPDHPVLSKWDPVGSMFCGFPCMITVDDEEKCTTPRLYMEQGTYENLEDAIADLEDPEKIDFSVVCDDIFGNG